MNLFNPFHANPVQVIKKISRGTFELHKEKYLSEYEMGEDSDYNEYYTLMTSKENPSTGLLIREASSHSEKYAI